MAYATETIFIVGLYALCSAGMLVINKLAVHHIGVPSFVTLCQFSATAGTVLAGSKLGNIMGIKKKKDDEEDQVPVPQNQSCVL